MPMDAGRSKQSFGLNLRLDYRFFNDTSSACQTNKTRHPTPIPFRKHEKETLTLRCKFFKSEIRSDYTEQENKDAWESIIADTTELATQHFLVTTGYKRDDVIPYSEMVKDVLYNVAEEAMIELRGMVARRTGKNGIAKTAHKPTPVFPNLSIPLEPVIYVMKDYIINGKHHCKIGFTENLEERLAQLRTGNPAIYVENTINPVPPITEHRVQKLFLAKKDALEWYHLDDADMSILKNPDRIRAMIISEAA